MISLLAPGGTCVPESACDLGAMPPPTAPHGFAATSCRLASLLFASVVASFAAPTPRTISVEKIWDGAGHNAFTDLIRFRGQFFCTFREGTAHVPEHEEKNSDGVVRILAAGDDGRWSSAAVLAEETIDLRDPHFSITPDGRLMTVMGGSLYANGRYFTRQPRVAFSPDGRTWTEPRAVLEDGDWLWRVAWHNGRAYGINKRVPGKNNTRIPKRGFLVSSADGLNWTTVTELKVPGIDEAALSFAADGEMTVLARREEGNNRAWLGRSRPPYREWTWRDCGTQVGGPQLIEIPGHGLWAGGRSYPDRKTKIGEIVGDRYEPRLAFPSGGDNAYPGFVWHEDRLWMSYYSSHEGKTSIYLAKVSLER